MCIYMDGKKMSTNVLIKTLMFFGYDARKSYNNKVTQECVPHTFVSLTNQFISKFQTTPITRGKSGYRKYILVCIPVCMTNKNRFDDLLNRIYYNRET